MNFTIALAFSGIHFLLLVVGAILFWVISRKLVKERNENVLELAKAQRKQERYYEQLRALQEQQQEMFSDDGVIEGNNNSPQQQQQQANAPYGSGRRNNYHNNTARSTIFSPGNTISGNNNTGTKRNASPVSYNAGRSRATSVSPSKSVATANQNNNNSEFPVEPLSPGTKETLEDVVVSTASFDRFRFVLLALAPAIVFLCCCGMWMAYVLRSWNAYWLGALPILIFLIILLATLYSNYSCEFKIYKEKHQHPHLHHQGSQ